MDRLELKTKFAGRIKQFRLEEFDLDLHLHELSALDRAKLVDKYRVLDKTKDAENQLENVTIQTQCFIVSRGLVDAGGKRIYADDEADKIAEEFPCNAIDKISQQILVISGMIAKAQDEAIKNSRPDLNGSSSSDSPHGSGDGTPTGSSVN